STDYGTTYERLNDKVGVKTVLSYLYVCPTNQRKVMVLTDPEFESSVLISSDEGASYQKYRLSFYVLSLLFHPSQEDWALAYSHDQKKQPSPGKPSCCERLLCTLTDYSCWIKGVEMKVHMDQK
ncbi:VPS10 domain-containing receptor SorCS1-like, partial [Clarias magur]